MNNDAEDRLLKAQIVSEQAIIEAMESSSNSNPRELENHRKKLKGLLLEKAERDRKRQSN